MGVTYFETEGQMLVYLMLEQGIAIAVEDRPKMIQFLNERHNEVKQAYHEEGRQRGLAEAIDLIKEKME